MLKNKRPISKLNVIQFSWKFILHRKEKPWLRFSTYFLPCISSTVVTKCDYYKIQVAALKLKQFSYTWGTTKEIQQRPYRAHKSIWYLLSASLQEKACWPVL
jgi:hypothetical protein